MSCRFIRPERLNEALEHLFAMTVLTRTELADAMGRSFATAWFVLHQAEQKGLVFVVGAKRRGKRGKSAAAFGLTDRGAQLALESEARAS